MRTGRGELKGGGCVRYGTRRPCIDRKQEWLCVMIECTMNTLLIMNVDATGLVSYVSLSMSITPLFVCTSRGSSLGYIRQNTAIILPSSLPQI